MVDVVFLGIIGFALMLLLIFLKVHIGIAMGLVGLGGAFLIIGPNALGLVKATLYGTTATYDYAVLPLFILMGMMATASGIAPELYQAALKWLGWLRGGLLYATTLSVGLFGACSGSSVATTTAFTKMCLPQLIEQKYDPGLSGGAIAAGGSQSALIPPSALLVFYGMLTEQSVGKLLLAGVVPGFLSVLIFLVTVWITFKIFPEKGPGKMVFSFHERMHALKGIWPIPVIFVTMIGGLFIGAFTPSEAGAMGALLTLIAGIILRGWKKIQIRQGVAGAVHTTAMIFFIFVSAMIFVRFVALTGVPIDLGNFIAGLEMSPLAVLVLILFIYIILGCILDAMGMVTLTIPIFYPIIKMAGIDGIWFGILLVKVVEIGLLTPPIGMNIFLVKGAAGNLVSTSQLFGGMVPFLIAEFATLVLLVAFPELSLWLPGHMK